MRHKFANNGVTRLAVVAFLFVQSAGCRESSVTPPAATLPAPGVVSPAPQTASVTPTASRPSTDEVATPVSSAVSGAVSGAAEKELTPGEYVRFFAAPVSDGWRFATPYHFHEWRLAAGLRGAPRFLTDATGARKRLHVGRAAPRIVILIDDLGNARGPLRALGALPFIVNGAILPHTPNAAFAAESIIRGGGDVLLHLPLQPLTFPRDNPGPGALWVTMPVETRNQIFTGDWGSVPRAIGFNNHMGSMFTADIEAMKSLAVASKSLAPVFMDSRTIAHSVAARQMLAQGIPSLGRTHFLDDNPGEQAVSRRLGEAISYAKRNGVAVVIGHPNRSTLRVLALAGQRLASEGVTAVAVHEIFRIP